MITVLCVLRSGGVYNAEWVAKLQRGVSRNLTIPHQFVCLSDCEVSCERIQLEHDWPKWWSKLEMFSRRVISGPTLYLDLDTVIVGNIDWLADLPHEFAMLRNFSNPEAVGSGVMWFRSVPHIVYDKFALDPEMYMGRYAMKAGVNGSHIGDQAFISDTLIAPIQHIVGPVSYKKHCRDGLPDASIVCFHGRPRPDQVRQSWMKEHWT